MSHKITVILLASIAALFLLIGTCSCARGNGNLRVAVQNTDGSPIIGAEVVSESQPVGQLKIDGITSEEAPVVVFNDIKAGKYQIQVSRYDYAPETIEVTVHSGKTENIVVKLYIASPPPIT